MKETSMAEHVMDEQQAPQGSSLPSGVGAELHGLAKESAALHQDATTSPIKMNVEHLNVFYGARHAIKDVSMRIHECQVTALMGPSGCGKSTFVRALDRMHDLTPGARVTGTVQLNGSDIYAPNVDVIHIRQQVGMVFQRPNPFPSSIFENVAYGLRIKRTSHTPGDQRDRGAEPARRGTLG